MKIFVILMACMLCLVVVGTASAEGPDSGFFFGGGANIQWISGSGTWGDYNFDISSPLSTEGDAVGLAWTDQMLLGVKPVIGYKFNTSFALQFGYGINITKPSRQSNIETNGVVTYEQGLAVEWTQRNFEALGVFYPNSDLNYYFFGGLDFSKVDTEITLFENASYPDDLGGVGSDGLLQVEDDSISALGFIFGAGLEFTSDNRSRTAYISVQYTRSMTDDTFFGTEDFKVDLGGFSLMAGMRWYPFSSGE